MSRKYFGATLGVILALFVLIGAATNYNRIILDEDPEITGANGETISNATDGRWTFSDDVNIPSGSYYMVNGTQITTSTALSNYTSIGMLNESETVLNPWTYSSVATFNRGIGFDSSNNWAGKTTFTTASAYNTVTLSDIDTSDYVMLTSASSNFSKVWIESITSSTVVIATDTALAGSVYYLVLKKP